MAYWNGTWFQEYKASTAIPVIVILTEWLNSFHVQCFTLVSGYLYAYLRFEKGRYERYVPFVQNKLKRLIVPYYFVAIIWVIPIGEYFFQDSIPVIIKRYFLGISPNQLWFLLMLFFVFATMWWLSNTIHKNLIYAILIAALFYIVGFIGARFENYFMIWRGCQFVPFFIIGMKLRQYHYEDKLAVLAKGQHAFLMVVLEMLIFAIHHYTTLQSGLYYRVFSIFLGLLLNAVGAIAAFNVLQIIANKHDWKRIKLVQIVTDNSMTIYLFHQQIIYIIIATLSEHVNPFINMVLNFTISTVVALLIAIIMTHNKYTRLLLGQK